MASSIYDFTVKDQQGNTCRSPTTEAACCWW